MAVDEPLGLDSASPVPRGKPGASPPVEKTALRATTDAGGGSGGAATSASGARTEFSNGPSGAAATSDAAARAAPAVFGRYRLDGEIARGGMGVIYRAFDTQLQRVVALKVMLGSEASSDEARRRFQREGLLAARLSHPNIVPVHEVGEIDGKLYFTMDLVAGESLQAVLHRMGRIPPRAAARIARDAARALAAAHAENVIHRDVKPANLLLTPLDAEPGDRAAASDTTLRFSSASAASFRVQVADFGLAKDLESESRLSKTGQVMGTLLYMSPEQANGDVDRMGPATDVYSLGAVLYEMLCGAPPFEAPNVPQMLAAVILKDPAPLRGRAPGLHPDLETIVAKAMAKEPARRYASARAMADDLDRYLTGEMIEARPASRAYRLWRKTVRYRHVVLPTAAAVLAVAGFLAYPQVGKWRAALAQAAERARTVAEREARARAAGSRIEAAAALLAAGRTREAFDAAAAVVAEYEPFFRQGEDLPVSRAHALEARAHRALGDAPNALLEFYRAFEAAIGRPDEPEALVEVGEHLAAMDEVERAQGVFARVLAEAPGARAAFRARFGLARTLLRRLRFDDARTELLALGDSPEATSADQAERERLLGFLALVTPATEVPFGYRRLVVADLDGDGRPELASLTPDGRDVAVGRIEAGVYRELSRVEVVGNGRRFALQAIDALDADGDGRPEILVAGGRVEPKDGLFAVLRSEGGRLAVAATTPLESEVNPRPFLVADLDGDKRPELVLATGMYERALRLYRYDAARHALAVAGGAPVGSEVHALAVRDADADGRPEVWAFAGPWRQYALLGLQPDPASGKWRTIAQAPFAGNALPDPGALRVPGAELLVGAGWEVQMLGPLRELVGRRRLEAGWRPPGAYRVRFGPGPSATIDPLWQAPWPTLPGNADVAVAVLAGPRDRYAWVGASLPQQDPDSGERVVQPVRLFRADGSDWRPFLTLFPLTDAYWQPTVADLDGDGEPELLLERPVSSSKENGSGSLLVLGMGRTAPSAARIGGTSPADAGARAMERRPRPIANRELVAGRAAEGFGLLPEACARYAEAVERVESEPDLAEAAVALVRCLMRLGRREEAAAAAERSSSRSHAVRGTLLRRLADDAEEAGDWNAALASAERLLTEPLLSAAEQRATQERIARLNGLVHPARVFGLPGDDLARCDLLATSPLCAVRGADGTLRLFGNSNGRDGLYVPVAHDRSSYRLRATLDLARLDWGTTLLVGVVAGEPWAGLGYAPGREGEVAGRGTVHTLALSSQGESGSPLRKVELAAGDAAGIRQRDLSAGGLAPGSTVRASLEYAAHRRLLSLTASVGGAEAAPQPARLRDVPLEDEQVFVSLRTAGSTGASGFWVEARLAELEFVAGGSNSRPVSYEPRRAVDLLLLANGRWIQGRVEDAARLYDRAVRAGDLEAAHQDALRAESLPSLADSPSARHFLEWASVDARFWRALFRAERAQGATGGGGGDDSEEAVQRDLREAALRSRERFLFLLDTHALPLAGRPGPRAALARFVRGWFETGGAGALARLCRRLNGVLGVFAPAGLARTAQVRFGRWLQEKLGADVADALLRGTGYGIRRRLVIVDARVEGAQAPPFAPGDVVAAYDGRTPADAGEFRRLQAAARDADPERTEVELALLRRGRPLSVRIDPRSVYVLVETRTDVVPTTPR
ncbi:MAG: protein kinase [Planctomycetes bacterium]|nr:protein kinase [Planctomycetota bacterium]